MVTEKPEDFDAIAIWEDDLEAAVQAFFVRRGRLVGRKGWTVDKVEPLTTAGAADLVPPAALRRARGRRAAADPGPESSRRRGGAVGPARRPAARHRAGSAGARIERSGSTCRSGATRPSSSRPSRTTPARPSSGTGCKRASDFDARSRRCKELQEALDLDEAPLRIECYDISHLGGTEVVASMVVFEDGLPKKSEYRRFKLSVDRNDDFAAMREVIKRRFSRLVEERRRRPSGTEGKFAYPPSSSSSTAAAASSAALEGLAR
jgi:excinuclease ABC subunit C